MTDEEKLVLITTLALIQSNKPLNEITDEEIKKTAEMYSRVEKSLHTKLVEVAPGIFLPPKKQPPGDSQG
ncbi:MAG: hypothetical protein FJ217_07960 [Ignavibacteria bacterium]|nr:hypothetical protein [Ignavibacteria bacterium]